MASVSCSYPEMISDFEACAAELSFAGGFMLGRRFRIVASGAVIVAAILFGYALMAGGRPPVLRSAVMVAVACGGKWLRRPVLLANSFALAWIVVALISPTDIFDTGCQLSFLSVAALFWGVGSVLERESDYDADRGERRDRRRFPPQRPWVRYSALRARSSVDQSI